MMVTVMKYDQNHDQLVGRSFNSCMKAIMHGAVKPEQVVYIVTSTAFKSREEFEKALRERYLKHYRWDVATVELALRFWDEGRIVQPRLKNPHFFQDISGNNIWEKYDGPTVPTVI